MEFIFVEVIFFSNIKIQSEKYIINFLSKIEDLVIHYLESNNYSKDTEYKIQYYDQTLHFKKSEQVPTYVCDLNQTRNVFYISL